MPQSTSDASKQARQLRQEVEELMIDIEIYTTRLQVGKNTWNEYEKRAKKLRDVICDERRRR